MSIEKPVLFSGIQPSGNLTLGNYLGALKNWVSLQHQYSCLFSIVDLHAITVRQPPTEFCQNCYDALAIYLAVGLDPKRNTIFLQSHVPAHSQLAWILNCYAYLGELNRMTQFKDKVKKNVTNINAGLLTYPILMAADILLYQTNLVPVGIDQKQHVEIARDLALRFNTIYGEIFTLPEIYHPPLGARIMSLQAPAKKMSKSDNDPNATLFLLDSPDVIVNKLKRAVTDSGREIVFDAKNKPGVANLLTILAAVTGDAVDKLVVAMEGQGYGKLKAMVTASLIEFLQPLQENYYRLQQDRVYLDAVLKQGADRAAQLSQKMLQQVDDALGFIPKSVSSG